MHAFRFEDHSHFGSSGLGGDEFHSKDCDCTQSPSSQDALLSRNDAVAKMQPPEEERRWPR